MLNQLLRSILPAFVLMEGEGGTGGGDTPRQISREEIEAQARAKIQQEGDAVKVIANLMDENFKLRRKRRATVKPEDVKALEQYRGLGTVEELTTIVKDHPSLIAFRDDRVAMDQYRAVANVANLNPDVLADVAKTRGLNFAIDTVKVKNAKGEEVDEQRSFVVVKDGDKERRVPIMDYVNAHLKEYVPVLVKDQKKDESAPAASRFPAHQESSSGGGATGVLGEYMKAQSESAKKGKNPLMAQ